MKRLAIIPARGGSKRIPRKNIKDFLGKPIIAYSIEAALDSELFDEVMVSTDDEEIAEIALNFGAKIPFLRSEESSNDDATLADVITEVLAKYRFLFNYQPSFFCTILSTAPFIKSSTLIDAYQIFSSTQADSLISASSFPSSIYKSFHLNKDGKIEFNFPEFATARSQDLPKAYFDAGQFYFTKYHSFKNYGKLSAGVNHLFELSKESVQDIDTLEDWFEAEKKFKSLKSE